MDILNEYTALVEALERGGVEYATCGGLAMAVHGFVRATKDIDLLIRDQGLEKAFTIAKTLGFNVEGLPLDFDGGAFKLRRLSKIDDQTHTLLTVDFIIVTGKVEDVWADRERADWGEGTAWVVSRRGLIAMKKYAGRPQDLVDISNLENADESEEDEN
jgi:hypothetical protein